MASDPEARVAATLARLPALCAAAEALVRRGRFVTTECLVGTHAAPVRLTIVAGRVTEVGAPGLLQTSRFAFRARPEAWLEFWRPLPLPGWHDLLALTKRGVASLEGDLHPFLANLQYFKDLLALPRGSST
jgi:hypothetical protein